ncbi:MAG: PilZ domain-containing protein [Phycisphaerae bacterium]
MQQQENRRRYTRLNCRVPGTLECDGTPFDANIVDVSLNGVAISTGALVDTQQPVSVKFDPVARGQMTVEASGNIIRNDNGRIAIRIQSIDPLSTQRLTAWLEANHPDPSQARAEVQALQARQVLQGEPKKTAKSSRRTTRAKKSAGTAKAKTPRKTAAKAKKQA